MNKSIIMRSKDLLLDLSIVHSSDINERIGWVLENAGANWLIERELVRCPDSMVTLPPFIVVSSTPVNGVVGFRTGKRHIHGIRLYESIDATLFYRIWRNWEFGKDKKKIMAGFSGRYRYIVPKNLQYIVQKWENAFTRYFFKKGLGFSRRMRYHHSYQIFSKIPQFFTINSKVETSMF